MHRADNLANAFTSAHSHSVPIVQSLQALLHIQSSPPEEHVEQHLSAVRDDLDRMETSVGEMMSMLYEVDVFLAQPETVLRAGFNPKEALSHVSELFHVRSIVARPGPPPPPLLPPPSLPAH